MSTESIIPTVSPDAEVPFEVVSENWNVYDLADGTILKIRPIVVKVFNIDQPAPNKGFAIASQNVLVVNAPKGLRGKPSVSTREDMEKLQKVAVGFTAKAEPWNVYKVNKITLKVRMIVTDVKKTEGGFDRFGQPLYFVKSDSIMHTE